MLQQLDTAIAFVVVMLLLSLLVTALVQAISALLDLRGRNLTRALTDLFKQIDPDLRKGFPVPGFLGKVKQWIAHPFTKTTFATKLADAVSKHPILAHTFTRAKAIRKEELIEVLQDLNSSEPAGKIETDVKSILNSILTAQLGAGSPPVSVSKLGVGVEKWFGTVMDRASDIFTRWTRIITIAVSVIFVFVLQIDAGMIFHQIATGADIRAGLTKLSDSALTQADEVLKNGNRASSALKEIAVSQNVKEVSDLLNAAPPLVTCAEGQSWLQTQKSVTADVRSNFQEACERQTVAALGKSEDQLHTIRRELAETQLKIVPDRIGDAAVFGETGDSLSNRATAWVRAYRSSSHLLGTLTMIVLLSLGAPFWYNALKQLSNLKPSITQKVDKETATP